MLASVRSALLMIAALTATVIAPAKAGPSGEPLLPVTSATLPKVVTPDLLDPKAEPTLSQPSAAASEEQAEEAEPAVATTASLADMVGQLRNSNAGSRELECLATGIYFESKSEPLAGQLAVGQVIANRTDSHGRFPSSYCGVLFQRGQFSFVHGSRLPGVPRTSRQWQTAVAIAKIVDRDLKESAAGDALFFHARYVSPGWRMKRVASIGNHVFYR
ncbi:cell wall hydrolase [Sphingomonas flavescens]|uniref:cell wall hydrolase n=1 Tax=Sphingomonas flavescens TaxID=3132797 RepID=UPI00280470CB|nr:cell wall hydrolase [Sphingomonas limnosediminicola]